VRPDSKNPLSATIEQSAISSGMAAQQTLVRSDDKVKPGGNNAFSILMSSEKETEVWKEASIDKAFGPKQSIGRRKAPFYKVLQGMPIAVDAFNFGEIPGVAAYFLTSVHQFISYQLITTISESLQPRTLRPLH
jgi:hypothetical protein